MMQATAWTTTTTKTGMGECEVTVAQQAGLKTLILETTNANDVR